MQLYNNNKRYSTITKILHWTIFVMFVLQYYWINMKNYVLPKGSELGIVYLRYYHKSLGVVVLAIAVAFIIWQSFNKKPAWDPSMPKHEYFAAKVIHAGLYVAILIMPISGMAMSMASGFPVKVFDFYTLPMLIEKNRNIASIAHDTHQYAGYTVFFIILIHIFASLKHHLIDKDNILKRMLPYGN